MEKKFFYDDEDLIGYSDYIAEHMVEQLIDVITNEDTEIDEKISFIVTTGDTLAQLRELDHELVICSYCVMDGSYIVTKYVEGKE